MNALIIINKTNLSEVLESIAVMAEKQESIVNGGLCIAYDGTIKEEFIQEVAKPLVGKFKSFIPLRVQVNQSNEPEHQIALIFGMFIMQAYSRFPGPWLIVDGEAKPTEMDFMNIIEKQHNSEKSGVTGVGKIGQGSINPIGPLVIDLPHKIIKFLRYPVNQSWRERGQFTFARARFNHVSKEDWVWGEYPIEEVVESEEKEEEPEKANTEPEMPTNFNEWTKKQLSDYIEQATGVKPHHNSGFSKLVNLAEKNTTQPA